MRSAVYKKAKELQDSIDYYKRALEKLSDDGGFPRILHIDLVSTDTQTTKLDIDAELNTLLQPTLAIAQEFITKKIAKLYKEFDEL